MVNRQGQATRQRLRAFHRDHPGVTMSDAARALGLSVQRVSQLAKQERLMFSRYITRLATDCAVVGAVSVDSNELRQLRADAARWRELVTYVENMRQIELQGLRRRV